MLRDGTYQSITNWDKTEEGDLAGEIELPMAVGIVGGVASVHPMAKLALKILGVKTSKELAIILTAAVLLKIWQLLERWPLKVSKKDI